MCTIHKLLHIYYADKKKSGIRLFITCRPVTRRKPGGILWFYQPGGMGLLLLLLLTMYCFKWHCHANDAGALYRVGYGVRKEWCLGRVRVRKVVKKLAKTEPGFLGMRQSTHFPPARESGECCKLPQRSPSRNLIWCILAEKLGIWWLHNTDTDW